MPAPTSQAAPLEPDLEWLARRWDLPESAFGAVRALMAAEEDRGTAVFLKDEPEDWGLAASEGGPLVLTTTPAGTALQSRRLFEAEREIARRLLALDMQASKPAGSRALEKHLAVLFPGVKKRDPQRAAVATAVQQRVSLITGGPGTGKTYTLAKALAAFLLAGHPASSIFLAAPTGKAAQRMKEAIAQSSESLPDGLSREDFLMVAASCGTLHSRLGRGPAKRLPVSLPPGSVLIVDECSMIDVYLWLRLLRALPEDAHLLLVGDPNQLESVGQGNVFSALAADGSPLPRTRLAQSRRFAGREGIARLAAAFEASDPEAAEAVLTDCGNSPDAGGLAFLPLHGLLPDPASFPAEILEGLSRIAFAPTPEAAMENLGTACILCAHRRFRIGAEALGEKIHAHLASRGPVINTPILIDRNDPETGLRNGTAGILHHGASGHVAVFPREGRSPLALPVARLPEFSKAWAMTVHRAQGSEYSAVLVIVPRGESPLATRELLYTAITRARESLVVAGDIADIRAAATRTSGRRSLLAFWLENPG